MVKLNIYDYASFGLTFVAYVCAGVWIYFYFKSLSQDGYKRIKANRLAFNLKLFN